MTVARASWFILAFCLTASAVHAANYPDKPIRLIVPYTPGGGVDNVGRPLMQRLAERLGQSIVFDNRGGAGGTIGTTIATRAAPDGYTIFISLNALTIAASIYPNLPYDPIRDLQPVTQLLSTSQILVVHPSLPVQSVKELLALAKAQPGKHNYGSQGVGTNAHFAMELLKRMAGVDLVHIPYKGGGPASNALLAGEVKVMFLASSFGVPLVQTGRLRALGVSTLKRVAALPDVPTVSESGVPGFENDGWWGVFTPAGTPMSIVNRLYTELAYVVNTPEMRDFVRGRGAEPVGSKPEVFQAYLRDEMVKWKTLVNEAGLKAD